MKRNVGEVFTTNRTGLASFLRYSGIPHIATVKVASKTSRFEFNDPENQCRTLEYEFLSGCAIADAMTLLEEDRELRKTMTHAILNGKWQAGKES
jgi:hypothetical protein